MKKLNLVIGLLVIGILVLGFWVVGCGRGVKEEPSLPPDVGETPNTGTVSGAVKSYYTLEGIGTVEVFAAWGTGESKTTTDSSGNYSLTGLPTGKISITASREGSYSTVVADSATVNFYYSVGGTYSTGEVSGTITYGGSPLAGAYVYITNGRISAYTTTSSQGAYSFPEVVQAPGPSSVYGLITSYGYAPAGTLTISACKLGYGGAYQKDISLSKGEKKTGVNLDIATDCPTIQGTITQPAGFSGDMSIAAGLQDVSIMSIAVGIGSVEANGNYTIKVPKGNLLLGATSSTWEANNQQVRFMNFDPVTITGNKDINYTLPNPPELSSPEDKAANQSLTPTFSWSAASGWTPDFYALSVSTTGESWAILTTQTSYTFLKNLKSKTTYKWRVIAFSAPGINLWDFDWPRDFTKLRKYASSNQWSFITQ